MKWIRNILIQCQSRLRIFPRGNRFHIIRFLNLCLIICPRLDVWTFEGYKLKFEGPSHAGSHIDLSISIFPYKVLAYCSKNQYPLNFRRRPLFSGFSVIWNLLLHDVRLTLSNPHTRKLSWIWSPDENIPDSVIAETKAVAHCAYLTSGFPKWCYLLILLHREQGRHRILKRRWGCAINHEVLKRLNICGMIS